MLLKPRYGLSTDCKDWYEAIRDFLANDCVCVWAGEVTSLDKSVFFWTRQGFDYGYGRGFRDQNNTNLDKRIFKAIEDFDTSEQRNVIGVIAIRVDDLLISGSDMFIEYIPHKMNGEFEADSYEGNEATYLRMEITQTNNEEFDGIILDANNYEGKSTISILFTIERERQTNRRRKTRRLFPDRDLGSWCGFRELHARARFTMLLPQRKRFRAGKFWRF